MDELKARAQFELDAGLAQRLFCVRSGIRAEQVLKSEVDLRP